MPRPGLLTRGRANRKVKTPGARHSVQRKKFSKTNSTCAVSGEPMHLPRGAKTRRSERTSRSSKRPNRPYGGYATASAVRRGVIKRVRDQ